MKNEFDCQYRDLLQEVLDNGIDEKNARTGHVCRSTAGQTLRFDLQKGFPILALRKIPLKVFIAEQIWFLTGEKNLKFLQKFTHIWNDFATPENEIAAAYGFRWRRHFGRDQIGQLIELLQKDPSSRHGVVSMWDPADDGLARGTAKKNIPCPFIFTVQIIGGALHLHLVIRSNDLILGCPHDAAGFGLLAHFLAEKLSVAPGILTISISNAHIYDIHLEAAREIVSRPVEHAPIIFHCPKNAFDRAEKGDENLVEEIFQSLQKSYCPAPSLGKLEIVL